VGKKVDLDYFIVIDVEATCYERNDEPANFQSEIIEIGLCVIRLEDRELVEKKSIIVRPVLFPVSPFCTTLTTLTPADVDKGISFKEACDILVNEYHSNKRAWGSWGDYDKNQFYKQSNRENVQYPLYRTHINIKNLYSLMFKKKIECGVHGACEEMFGKDSFDGTQHRGVDDAWNIARIFAEILKKGQ